jgi:hypothetical protein
MRETPAALRILEPLFREAGSLPKGNAGAKRLPPFSLRLTADERALLETAAAGVPLGTYIKAKALGTPLRVRRSGLAIEDRTALAKVLALLGTSHLASNLNQLAKAANTGSLPLTLETEAELLEAIRAVSEMRSLLMRALGLQVEVPA